MEDKNLELFESKSWVDSESSQRGEGDKSTKELNHLGLFSKKYKDDLHKAVARWIPSIGRVLQIAGIALFSLLTLVVLVRLLHLCLPVGWRWLGTIEEDKIDGILYIIWIVIFARFFPSIKKE